MNNGYLTLNEIQDLEMEVELAVLSSCESGYGKLIKGEGGMSISKSFLQAGCNSTIVSLWPVDDCSTADLMQYFYQGINEGLKKNVALRQAKLNYLNNAHPSRVQPYYWAGFVLVGDESAMWSSTSYSYYYFAILIISLIAISLFFFKSRQPS